MTDPFFRKQSEAQGNHVYQTYRPNSEDWLEQVATEYLALRSECEVPLDTISIEGIEVVDLTTIERILKKAVVPYRISSNFDVIRSDFGETIGYMLCEAFFGTEIGFKGLRDRETIQLPDRGIDIVGVEAPATDSEYLTLVLGETKVSDDKRTPPGVVDSAKDSLRNQHRRHMRYRANTARTIFNKARRVRSQQIQQRLLLASYLLEQDRLDRFRIVAGCILVRSEVLSSKKDCGSFQSKPQEFLPANVRFLRVELPDTVEAIVKAWYSILQKMVA